MKRLAVALGLIGLVTFGCSSDEAAAPVPLDHFPQEFAKAYCSGLQPCCGKAGLAYNAADCNGRMTEEYTFLVTEASGPNTSYDADAAGDCLAKVKSALEHCQDLPFNAAGPVCQGVFKGKVPVGGACQRSLECASDNRCIEGVCASVAGEYVHAKEGESCGCTCEPGPGTDCYSISFAGPECQAACYISEGLVCPYGGQIIDDPSIPPPVCVRLVAVGESCETAPCEVGAYCDFEQQVCVAARDSGPCSDPLMCSASSYCSADPTFGGPGECLAKKPDGYACQEPWECKNGECGGGTEEHRTCGPTSIATPSSCGG